MFITRIICLFVCRGLVRKYTQVIQRYYVQYLSGYDAIALDQAIQVFCLNYSFSFHGLRLNISCNNYWTDHLYSLEFQFSQGASHSPEEDSILLSSICHTIANVSVEQVRFIEQLVFSVEVWSKFQGKCGFLLSELFNTYICGILGWRSRPHFWLFGPSPWLVPPSELHLGEWTSCRRKRVSLTVWPLQGQRDV